MDTPDATQPAAPPDPAAAAPPAGQQVAPAGANATPDGGMQTAYFGVYVGGGPEQGGKPVGLFRVTDDEESKALAMERMTPTGEWADDPALIDDLREPGVFPVDEQTADEIASQIVASASEPAPAAPPQPQPQR